MIVEDNPHARQALKAVMSMQAGIKVTGDASNGQEAINIIEELPPDLVLMDMRMPVMDGLETTKIIKQNWPQIKIIILTIHSECQSELLSAGADAFLIKGCPTNKMMSSIHNLLHTR
jgi:DNA-binding NarL/FixJ family response regulator